MPSLYNGSYIPRAREGREPDQEPEDGWSWNQARAHLLRKGKFYHATTKPHETPRRGPRA